MIKSIQHGRFGFIWEHSRSNRMQQKWA
jgi:hypothetical protein